MKWLVPVLMMVAACDGAEPAKSPPDGTARDATVLDAAVVDRSSVDAPPSTLDAAVGLDGPADQVAIDAGGEAPAGPRPVALTWVREGPNARGDVIRGTAADDVWLVSKGGDIWHSRGDGTWQDRSDERSWQLTGVWGSGPDDVYVSVLANFVYHWNGTAWGKQTDGIPIGLTYRTIWGSGPNDIIVAGPSVYRSNGDGRWMGQTVPLTVGPFVDIWSSGPNDIWVLANNGVARWKGDGQWRAELGPRERGAVDIWGSGPNDVYVLYFDAVAHTDGSGTWTFQSVPEKRGPDETFSGIWGFGAGRCVHRRKRWPHLSFHGRWALVRRVDRPAATEGRCLQHLG